MNMKYLSSRVWITNERIMLVYLKIGNKRGIIRMKVLVSEDHHSCLRCPYNPECKLTCYELERMLGLQEKVKEEFQKQRGGQFQPELVDVLMEHWDEIYSLYRRQDS